jgi:biotin synthase
MGRWGLEGMSSFEQHSVARKEGERLAGSTSSSQTAEA